MNVTVEPLSNRPGSAIFADNGRVRSCVGGTDINEVLGGWYWFTYERNVFDVPPRNSLAESLRYPNEAAATKAAYAFICGSLDGGEEHGK